MSARAHHAAALWAACVLGSCAFDGSLGSHEPAKHEAAQAADDQASSDSTTTPAPHVPSETPADEHSAPPIDASPADEPVQPPVEPTPDAASDDTPPPPDTAAEPPPVAESDPPFDASMPIEHPDGCDTATDNPCLVCDQTSCCEPRRACLELEGCACNLRCELAESPAECRGACADPGERYEPWLSCLVEHCSEHCTL